MQDESIPKQSQPGLPGSETRMTPEPDHEPRFPGVGKLEGRVAVITGGDSGIGRAVAVLYAREGADVAIAYLEEDDDARATCDAIEAEGRRALAIRGDLGGREHCFDVVRQVVETFGRLDILVNNAARQEDVADLRDIPEEQLRRTFDTNVMAYFFLTQAALDHLPEGGSIVNTASVNDFKGNDTLVDYTATRGAVTAFTRSMALQLVDRGIRVNSVAPGPVWTPLIPASMPAEKVEGFGKQCPMGRAGQPWEIATSYLFLASSDGSFFTGQTLHPNGGYIVGA